MFKYGDNNDSIRSNEVLPDIALNDRIRRNTVLQYANEGLVTVSSVVRKLVRQKARAIAIVTS